MAGQDRVMGDRVFEILAGGLDLLMEIGPVEALLILAGAIVLVFLLLAIVEDSQKIVEDLLFWRWVKKDGNFALFETEKDARKGYERHLENRAWLAKTGYLRKRGAKNGTNDKGVGWMKENIAAGFTKLSEIVKDQIRRVSKRGPETKPDKGPVVSFDAENSSFDSQIQDRGDAFRGN